MICLKHATLKELINRKMPLDTKVYWVDVSKNEPSISNIYDKYFDFAELFFGVEKKTITSKTRTYYIIEIRNIVWTALYNIEKFSLISIGKLSKRNHSSVLNGIRSINNRMNVDKALRRKYNAFCNSIGKEINSTFDEKFND